MDTQLTLPAFPDFYRGHRVFALSRPKREFVHRLFENRHQSIAASFPPLVMRCVQQRIKICAQRSRLPFCTFTPLLFFLLV